MSINNIDINGALAALSAGTNQPATAPAGKPKQSDRDMFMTLLVEQLKHQDPLAPQDGAQFVAQLAQFNSLDQLISINQRLDLLVNRQS
ncbi:MAG: flagellar hook assembly protein FlgD [Pyrinomonadaceae bacterium]